MKRTTKVGALTILDKPVELAWAYATRQGFKGEAPGNFFRYFRTRIEAQKSIEWMKRNNRWHGPIEYRPGECRQLGYM